MPELTTPHEWHDGCCAYPREHALHDSATIAKYRRLAGVARDAMSEVRRRGGPDIARWLR